jgi:chromate transport protein ChrA
MTRPTLRQLVTAVALDTNRTVGGGLVSIELLRRRFTRNGWIDPDAHALFIAVSRFTPGTVVLAYCVTLAWRLHRWLGALLALTVASAPCSLIIFALTVTLTQIERFPFVRTLLAVGILVASMLVLGSAWHLIRPYLSERLRVRALVITAVAAALIVLGATPVRVLLVAAIVSCSLPLPEPRR